MRELSQLIDDNEPAWPLIQSWINKATASVQIIPVDRSFGEAALLATQVTTRSPMGSIIHNTAGIFIDNGWLRILGAGGHARFRRSLPEWNYGRSENFLLIADDALGGSFAINSGAFGDDLGNIYFFSPDSLEWEACGFGYSQFLIWAMSKQPNEFYKMLRWKNWESEVTPLTGDQAISIYPFLWAEGPPIEERHRETIPVAEQYAVQLDLRRQLSSS